MKQFLEILKNTKDLDNSIELLKKYSKYTENIDKALQFSIKAHQNQYRKSGEPYVIHPVLVATIAAYYSNDEAMIIAALLHDVVEDTKYNLDYIKQNFGDDVAHIVDGLTKITEIRDIEFKSSIEDSKTIQSALTFRKMLIASIKDIRILLVKLFDRLHNMLTLEALPKQKQIRISKESLVVYVPIAHRLGISTIKNILEDLSFYYIYPQEYKKIDDYIKKYQAQIEKSFDEFISDLKQNLSEIRDLQIFSRIKHYYSIFLKMQRKGINIDEVLDLLALRVITKNVIDCYKVLGIIHTSYKPLISRFKDYIAIPKENGYQTIHTTVFNDSKIFEIQIRTQDMHKVAEFGIAAHYRYKEGFLSAKEPNLAWLKSLEIDKNEDIVEFYDETKQELYTEDIIVYSPKGDVFTLPRGSSAYDFAYLIHTDIGNRAVEAYINKVKKPLLTELKSGDIVSIITGKDIILRCSWIDMVKTTKAKKSIKLLCQQRIKKINELVAINILNTIFSRYVNFILDSFKGFKLDKVAINLDILRQVKRIIEKRVIKERGFFARLKMQNIALREQIIDDIVIYSNFTINKITLDHCCHPKIGDDIVAFKDGKNAIIHHKLCEQAFKMMQEKKQMLFCKWSDNRYFSYKAVVSLQNKRGELAKLLTHLSKNNATILFIEYGRDRHSLVQYCDIEFEIKNSDIEEVKKIVSQKAKIIEFYSKNDAFNKK